MLQALSSLGRNSLDILYEILGSLRILKAKVLNFVIFRIFLVTNP